MIMHKRKFFLIFLISFFSSKISAQSLLTNINASWSTVLPGKVVSQPQLTSQGFCIMTDARNIISFTSDGKIIWEKSLQRFNSPFFCILPYDFTAVITNNKKRLTLLNSDGLELWVKNLDFEIIDNPFGGRDGRFFVRGNKELLCYTISGLQKWRLETPEQSNLPIQELSDGTIIIFLKKLEEGKSQAIRITPFGEVIEHIVFAGEVITSLTTPKGVLLTFTDGQCGLFDIIDNKATHKWLFNAEKNAKYKKNFFVMSQNKKDIIYINHLNGSIQIDYVDTEDGSVFKSFIIQNISDSPTCFYNDSGIFISDSQNAFFYNNSGKQTWAGGLPPKSSREYYNRMIFTNDNHLILFGVNWTINAFRTSQSAKSKNSSEKEKKELPNYNSFYSFDDSLFNNIYSIKLDSNLTGSERFTLLQNGNYGSDEQQWISQLLGNCTMYLNFISTSNTGTRVEKSVFESDSVGLEKMLAQLSAYQTSTFNEEIVSCLKKVKNNSLLHSLISSYANNGYDPEELVLKELSIFCKNINPKDEVLLSDVCDAVYSICRIMGSKAFNDYGKMIYTEMLYPKYTSRTRDYAREKLKLLINKQ
jgi:hypothetical protein